MSALVQSILEQAVEFLKTPYGIILMILAVLLLIFLIIIPLMMRLRRKRLKNRETRNIMRDLFTWRHLARLVKGGDKHDKAKQELSDNIVRINELLRQGFVHVLRDGRSHYNAPWYIMLGEPRSGKSSLLAASELELSPSAEEDNPQSSQAEDPRQSLPVRFWTGAKAVVCDVSGKVFFDRWLEESSAEWSHIVRQICWKRRRRALDGVILTIPADALMADDENLSSRKAILMANELGKLLRESGMRLPCYVMVTKLDMVSGFQEYARVFSGDLRHQILGFENDGKFFNLDTFAGFWNTLVERLRSGAKQQLFPIPSGEENAGVSRMDLAGKIWLFPDNFSSLYTNLKIYLDTLFGKDNFHGTKNTFFEGVYFSSARDMGVSLSSGVAALAGRNAEELLIPVTPGHEARETVNAAVQEIDRSVELAAINAGRAMIAPHLQKMRHLHGYFIRDLLHRRIFAPSSRAEFTKAAFVRRHIPHFAACAAMFLLGVFWLSGAVFQIEKLRANLAGAESYYEQLDGVLQRGGPFRSPLIKEDPVLGFIMDAGPVEGEPLPSRLQFYRDAIVYRDLDTHVPLSLRISRVLVFGFGRNMGYRDKAFIVNQLHKAMVRIPVIKKAGDRLIERVDTQVLDRETRETIASFVSLDATRAEDFYKFFAGSGFRLDSMIRYLMPDISDDRMELLNDYRPRYDKAWTRQADLDYIYSADYRQARRAALDTILSAWWRREVYPDSVYWNIRELARVSEEISVNYDHITAALTRINDISTLQGVEGAVFEWYGLTDRHRNLAARGRADFEKLRILLRDAGIPLLFESSLPTLSVSSEGISLARRPPPDAFGDNLINEYVFNDLVTGYAVQEYTRLYEADMEFIRRENETHPNLGAVIAEQNAFSGSIHREMEDLRNRAVVSQNSQLFSGKIGDNPDDPSLFTVVEQMLPLTSAISLPLPGTAGSRNFRAGWKQGEDNIGAARSAFEAYVRPYAENDKMASLIADARVMILAAAFYERYRIFTGSLSFLNTSAENIAAVIEAEAGDANLFSFSAGAIEELFGGFYYRRGHDPSQVKIIADNVASFVSLFTGEEENLPLFMLKADRSIYQPQAFMNYLADYFSYWENYPETVYVPVKSWEQFRARAGRYRSFHINSVLHSIYTGSFEAVTRIDDSLLSAPLLPIKTRAAATLGDRLAMMNNFLGTDAERMFSAWATLPADSLAAWNIIQNLSDEDIKTSYLAVYTPPMPKTGEGRPQALAIGWWNSFILNGLDLLAGEANTANIARLMENMDRYQAWPIASDALRVMSPETMRELAAVLETMGVKDGARQPDSAAIPLVRQNMFRGPAARGWAETVYQIAEAVTDPQKPLFWTLYQAPTEIQQRLGQGRLLAINRFRYVGASREGTVSRMHSTYMNENQALLQGNAETGGLNLKFYLTSSEQTPRVELTFDRPWAIFELYLRRNFVADDSGNIYIPLYFEEDAHQYVYYVALEFNREIPAPSSWYSLRNWPNLTISGGTVTERR